MYVLLFTCQKQTFTINITKQTADDKINAKQNTHTGNNSVPVAPAGVNEEMLINHFLMRICGHERAFGLGENWPDKQSSAAVT